MTNKNNSHDDFTGTSELWFNNENTDTVKFSGGGDTVEHIIRTAKEDYEDLKKYCAPGVSLAPQSLTFWFD